MPDPDTDATFVPQDFDNDSTGLTQVITNREEIARLFSSLLTRSREEILLVLPTTQAFYRQEESGILHSIGNAAKAGMKVRILSPADQHITDMILHQADWDQPNQEHVSGRIEYREINSLSTKTNLTVVICDRKTSLAVELEDDLEAEFMDSIGTAMFSKSKPTVLSYLSFFDALWNESEARERLEQKTKELQISVRKSEKEKNQAALLQDLTSHDIRNHLQIALLALDCLESGTHGKDGLNDATLNFKNLREALNDISSLLDKVRRLGKILNSSSEPPLYTVSVDAALQKAVEIVSKATNKNAKAAANISLSYLDPRLKSASVVADDFLEEVFVNLLSNSIKFTETDVRSKIDVIISKIDSESKTGNFRSILKISISDNARGISENRRNGIFSRYLKSATGSGLGMSIVHALIVERYGGRIGLSSRIEGDYTKGTVIDLMLPLA